VNNNYDLRHFASTTAALYGLDKPDGRSLPAIQSVIDVSKSRDGSPAVERFLAFHPDALGRWLYEHYRHRFGKVETFAPIQIQIQSMFPPKTPVCFSSIYSGLTPTEHGIVKYEKPVLAVPTVFDWLAETGKKVAIVAVADSSMDCLFRERNVDYYIEQYDPLVTFKALELIQADEHDFIAVYLQEYDDMLHRTTPGSEECLNAMQNHINSFDKIAEACNLYWKDYKWGVAFAPDHGSHIDPETGRGDHGLDIPNDINLTHFWGIHFPH